MYHVTDTILEHREYLSMLWNYTSFEARGRCAIFGSFPQSSISSKLGFRHQSSRFWLPAMFRSTPNCISNLTDAIGHSFVVLYCIVPNQPKRLNRRPLRIACRSPERSMQYVSDAFRYAVTSKKYLSVHHNASLLATGGGGMYHCTGNQPLCRSILGTTVANENRLRICGISKRYAKSRRLSTTSRHHKSMRYMD